MRWYPGQARNPTHQSWKLLWRSSLKMKKKPQAFLGTIHYLHQFSPSTADTCEPIRKLMSVKTEWTWNATYQKMFNKTKSIIKEDRCMKFNFKTKEMDASRVGLGPTLLQTRNSTSCPKDEAPDNSILRPIEFTSKSLARAEKRYSNIERETLGILCGLEKFHQYCFAREVSIIIDHKQLVIIF